MSEFGIEEGRRLLEAGWRQGATFYVTARLAELLKVDEGTILIVLSQSCVVVSSRLDKDPRIEFARATEAFAEPYSEKGPNSNGKNRTHLYIALGDPIAAQRYQVDLNTRGFFPREVLLDMPPDGPACSLKHSDRLAGFVSRSYQASMALYEAPRKAEAGDS